MLPLSGVLAATSLTVAEGAGPLTTPMGMVVTPHYTLENSPRPDIIVLPGGDVNRTAESAARGIRNLRFLRVGRRRVVAASISTARGVRKMVFDRVWPKGKS